MSHFDSLCKDCSIDIEFRVKNLKSISVSKNNFKIQIMTEQKRNGSVSFIDKDDMIALLLPPESIKNEYVEQEPAKYIFKCMDGDIHVPEYGILRTEFYYQDPITYYFKES